MINQPSPQPAAGEPSPASAFAPLTIRPQLGADIAAIVAFSVRAWRPVYFTPLPLVRYYKELPAVRED